MVLNLIMVASVIMLLLLTARISGVIYVRLLSIPVLCIIFTICLVIFSGTAVKAALKGLNLWAAVVVPSLLPFFIASGIINATGFPAVSGALLEPVMRPFFNVPGCSAFALVLGVTSGYPVGAKVTSDLRKSGALTKAEAERLLAFTNNSGPLFITGAVGTGIYGSTSIGLLLFICHLLSCITVGFLFKFYRYGAGEGSGRNSAGAFEKCANKIRGVKKEKPENSSLTGLKSPLAEFRDRLIGESRLRQDLGTLLGSAVRDSVSTLLAIGGYIVVFSVVISLLDETGIIRAITEALMLALPQGYRLSGIDGVLSGLLSGMLEITTGSGLVGQQSSVPLDVRLPAASFIIGWAGLSVHLQVMSIVSVTDINTRPYLLGKFLQGITAAIYTFLGTKLFRSAVTTAEPTLGITGFDTHSFFRILGRSLALLSAALIIWILLIYRSRSRCAAGR